MACRPNPFVRVLVAVLDIVLASAIDNTHVHHKGIIGMFAARVDDFTAHVLDDPKSWVGVYWDQDPRVFTSSNRFQGNTY